MPQQSPSPGRLELTWTNKHLRLLDDLEGGYSWVDPADWRVAEVRLLEDVETYGQAHSDAQRAKDNLLIEGDALAALRALTDLPEFAKEYVGRVNLVYIDPPFNTGQTFTDYDDALEHSVWLTMLRDRLLQIERLLADDGTVWVHLDHTEVHRARVVLDEVFGPANHIASVAWQRTSAKSNTTRGLQAMHELILVYGKKEVASLNEHYLPIDEEAQFKRYGYSDDGGRYMIADLTAGGISEGEGSAPWRGYDPKDRKRHWSINRKASAEIEAESGIDMSTFGTLERLDLLDEHGYVHWSADGSTPYLKRYLRWSRGRALGDFWDDVYIGPNNAERTGFSTQKPEVLLKRIIELSTEPGDIVLDCFGGSGTTAAAAHKMSRRWITVERSAETMQDYLIPRLRSVISGEDELGITKSVETKFVGDLPDRITPSQAQAAATVLRAFKDFDPCVEDVSDHLGLSSDADEAKDAVSNLLNTIEYSIRRAGKTRDVTTVEWQGGGALRHLRVADSMFVESDASGRVMLADWACDDRLAEATAAQLGFEYSPEGPIAGKQGRQRLAVIDGLVNRPVIEALIEHVEEDHTLVICGTAIGHDAKDVARELRRGTRVRKIPASILNRWRRTEGGL